MSKITLDPPAKGTETTREGGRERPKVVTPDYILSQSRSGSASTAASLLDLRQRVNFLFTCLEKLAATNADSDLIEEIQSVRRRGFQRGR